MKALVEYVKKNAVVIALLVVMLLAVRCYSDRYYRLTREIVNLKVSSIQTSIDDQTKKFDKISADIVSVEKKVESSAKDVQKAKDLVEKQEKNVAVLSGKIDDLKNKAKADLAAQSELVSEDQFKSDVKEIKERLGTDINILPKQNGVFSLSLTGGQIRAENSLFRIGDNYKELSVTLSKVIDLEKDVLGKYDSFVADMAILNGLHRDALKSIKEIKNGYKEMYSLIEKELGKVSGPKFFRDTLPAIGVGAGIMAILLFAIGALGS